MRIRVAIAAATLSALAAVSQAQTPLGTAFTYQGRLSDGGAVASGLYDLEVTLFNAGTGGEPVPGTPVLALEDVPVTAGLFTVRLDFGTAFAGGKRWLEIGVRPGASTGAYTPLTPRQEVTPTPSSVFSQGAPWTGVSGKPAGFADGVDNDALGGLACASGQVAKWAGVAWACGPDADSGGTLTGVAAGTGLTGGGTSGVVSLGVNLAGSGSATSVSRSDHDHVGQVWDGNTAGINFAVRNAAVDGIGLAGINSATTGFGWGVYAQSDAAGGAALYAVATSATGSNAGVVAAAASADGTAVYGSASSASGFALGVAGYTFSTQGIGVWGYNTNAAAIDTPIGVEGRADSPVGIGVNAFAAAGTGENVGLRAASNSPQGWAGYFVGRSYFSGMIGIGTTTPTPGTMLDVNGIVRSGAGGFRFPDGTTQATAAANPAADITAVTAGTGLTGGGTSGAVTLAVDASVQRRTVPPGCPGGQFLVAIAPDGSPGCAPAGDITQVIAGPGLVGGSPSGDAVLAADFGGSGSAATVSRTDHDHHGQTWIGTDFIGLQVSNSDGIALSGMTTATTGFNKGVYGEISSVGVAVHGVAGSGGGGGNYGVAGESNAPDSTGVFGGTYASTGVNIGVFGLQGPSPAGYAGYFDGRVAVSGVLSKGGGSFKIDHPLDPENRYLYHSFVESPDMKNIYDGVVTTGPDGFATVEMPEWFGALNRDFRYQLTVIGQFAQAIVARKLEGNRFTIQTDKPEVEVSWQVTGIRKDPFAEKHRIPVEEDKPADERGTFLHPTEWGRPKAAGLNAKRVTLQER